MTSHPKPHRSVGIMVAASLINACCGAILTFSVPRFLSVDDFGLWRAFLLYAGYAGMLHLGLLDGALLLWSRNNSEGGTATARSMSGLRSAIQFVVVEHLLLLGIALASLLLPVRPSLPLMLIGLAIYALIFNLVGVLQIYLQTSFRFAGVAIGLSAPPALFVAALGVLALTSVSFNRLLFAYLGVWGIALVTLLWMARSESPKTSGESQNLSGQRTLSTWKYGLKCIATGWPIMLANSGYGFMQSADRITVNLFRPLHDFAIYSLSQSTIYVPVTLLAALSRVAFSWFARAQDSERAGLYGASSRILALLWMLLLPYYFLVEWVVRRFLPRYVLGLQAGLVLLLSVLFLSLIGIVQFNTFSLCGRQRQFFASSLGAVLLAFATAWFGSQKVGTLTAVAWSQVLTAGLWWLANECFLRAEKLMQGRDILTILATFTLSTAGLYLSSLGNTAIVLKPLIYYGFGIVPVLFLYQAEFRNAWSRAVQLQTRLLRNR